MNFVKSKPEDHPDYFIEIKGFNICPAGDWLEKTHNDKNWSLVVGDELKYQPKSCDTSIMIRRQEAFQLAIDIIGQNPLLLLEWFKRRYKIMGDLDHAKTEAKDEREKDQD